MGQTPGPSRSRHHIRRWELGKGALGERRQGESAREHPLASLPPQRRRGTEAGWPWPCPSQACRALGSSPPHNAVQPQGLCTRRSPRTRVRDPHVVIAEKGFSERAQPLVQPLPETGSRRGKIYLCPRREASRELGSEPTFALPCGP